MTQEPIRIRAPYFSNMQKKLLFDALDALIGDSVDGDSVAWATDQERRELKTIRGEMIRFYKR